MRRREVVEIDNRKYEIQELTVKDIIELTENSQFLNTLKGGAEEQKPSVEMNDLQILREEFTAIMERCCDFTVEDVQKHNLAPSDIRKLYDKWVEVNSDFLAVLKAVGIAELFVEIKNALLTNFLRMLAT